MGAKPHRRRSNTENSSVGISLSGSIIDSPLLSAALIRCHYVSQRKGRNAQNFVGAHEIVPQAFKMEPAPRFRSRVLRPLKAAALGRFGRPNSEVFLLGRCFREEARFGAGISLHQWAVHQPDFPSWILTCALKATVNMMLPSCFSYLSAVPVSSIARGLWGTPALSRR